jgi:hypothetical protein
MLPEVREAQAIVLLTEPDAPRAALRRDASLISSLTRRQHTKGSLADTQLVFHKPRLARLLPASPAVPAETRWSEPTPWLRNLSGSASAEQNLAAIAPRSESGHRFRAQSGPR